MTYQHAPMEEWTPYLAYALRPLRPVVLAGVSARKWLGEWKEPNQACMQWWKVCASVFNGGCAAFFFGSPSVLVTRLVSSFCSGHASAATKYVGLPYMADASHSEDTVFFVAEGDFRFYREDAAREGTLMDQLCALYRLGRSLDLVGSAEGVWKAPIPHGTPPSCEPVAQGGGAPSTGLGEPVAPSPGAGLASAAVPAAPPAEPEAEEDCDVYTSPDKGSPAEFDNPSPELLDLLAYMTAAAKHERGNLVWFGWNASPTGSDKPKRSTAIANGSQLIAITAKGARWMKHRLEAPRCARACVLGGGGPCRRSVFVSGGTRALLRFRSSLACRPPAPPRAPRPQPMKDYHFDLVLLRLLIEGWQDPEQLGACYVVPPIGSFIEHVTGCSMDRPGRIPGHWGCKWQQDGTRKNKEGDKDRWLAGFTPKGEPIWLGTREVCLPQDHPRLRWLTEPYPGLQEERRSRTEAGEVCA